MRTCSWAQYAILGADPAIFRLPGFLSMAYSPIRDPKSTRHSQEHTMNAAADQVMDLIFGRWRSQILSAGTELGVFDHLDIRRAKTAQTLAAELGADPPLL